MRGLRQPAGHAGLRDETPAGTGGGSGITGATSGDGTIELTNPTGPTTDFAVNPAHVVTSFAGLVGTVTESSDSLLPQTIAGQNIATGQTIAANWAAATVRYYALDGVNGNDANAGFSDVSATAAGAAAKKTIAGMAAIFPQNGRDRKVVLLIAAASYAGQGGLDLILGSCYGYAPLFPLVRATVTSATAGCTAFDNSVADKLMAGFVTATGMNAAGYNPVAAFDVSAIKCLTVAAGAPAFPAEPGLPLGCRIRFDANTTTAALRNVSRPIIGIAAADTLTLPNNATSAGALPAVPVGTDIFYIEMPGVTIDQTNLLVWQNNGTSAVRPPVQQIVGVNFSGFPVFTGGRLILAGCFGSVQAQNRIDTPFFYTDESNTARTVGLGLRCAGQAGALGNAGGNGFNALGANAPIVAVGPFSVAHCSSFNLSDGSYFGAGLQLLNCRADPSINAATTEPLSLLGGRTINGQSPIRVVGSGAGAGITAGTILQSTDLAIGRCSLTGAGAHPALALIGKCAISAGATLAGSTGNTDVGLDLTLASGCTIILDSAPTVTGTNGDVRLANGNVVSWAVAFLGLVDSAGNRFVSGAAASVPTVPTTFSGALLGGAAQVIAYLANMGTVGAVNQLNPFAWPTSSRYALRLRANMRANSATGVVTLQLMKNGVGTAQLVTWNAGVVGAAQDFAHPILFQDTDTYDLRILNAGADVGAVSSLSAAIEWGS
jgi:hypothetical protein